jgi:methionyl aminopeptidase
MSITAEAEMQGMKRISEVVGHVLKAMREHAKPGMTTKELDDFGGKLLLKLGARSAPYLTYGFPGYTCISTNNEIAHGIPSDKKLLEEGDLINIDVSAELDGYWADNGGSFVLGQDHYNYQPLVDKSQRILMEAISQVKAGVRIAEIGRYIETTAKRSGFKVIRNLAGHGVGRSLHEPPEEILNCYDRFNWKRFRKNSVVAVETFIATSSSYAVETTDGWTLVGNKGGYVAQHEHTIVVTDDAPIILTKSNGIS